jgi:predicted metal-dependent hydrolase
MPVLPGNPPLDVILRRSTRTRRFSLRVSRLDGTVILSLPARARVADAMEFARSHEPWLRETLAKLPLADPIGPGAILPFEGHLLTLLPGEGRSPRIAGTTLLIPGDPAQMAIRTASFLKFMARERLVTASERYAAMLGVRFSRITLRDTRSRWGSCSSQRALMYSWRLIMAPAAVLDYVAAHEVAHLVEMNHSPAFWAIVTRLCPEWQRHRDWLRQHGQELHHYRFGD